MILDVNSKTNDITYPIVIERNALKKVNEYLKLNDKKVLIITDSGVPQQYLDTLKSQINNPLVYIIKQGEESKNFDNYKAILEFMVNNKFTRTDCVIALGGGVVGDLSGFVSGSYMRGITFYNIPTTLLSQVDSSIGGKCAIDFLGVKNNIGCFNSPKAVIIDPKTLNTLDDRQFNAGMAEVIKMSLTSNKELFEYILNNNAKDNIEYVISEALKIKKYVVETDPFEKDLRKVLNFGHTIGHAIEAINEPNLLHGECVALGMMYMVSSEVKESLIKVLNKYNLKTNVKIDNKKVINLIKVDKKASGNMVSIVYVDKIGSFEFRKIEIDKLNEYLK